jgi:hypothetical protein
VASPLAGWLAEGASLSEEESESTTMLWERPWWVALPLESMSSLSGSSEASGPASLVVESCSELAAEAVGEGPSVTLSERKGPQALNFRIPAVMRLVSQAGVGGDRQQGDRSGVKVTDLGVLDTGVSRSTCSWATSTAQLRPRSIMKTEA